MSVYPHKGKNVLGKDKNFVLQQYGRFTQTFKAQMYLYIHIRAKTYLVRTKIETTVSTAIIVHGMCDIQDKELLLAQML